MLTEKSHCSVGFEGYKDYWIFFFNLPGIKKLFLLKYGLNYLFLKN